jgi:hypothetical protein
MKCAYHPSYVVQPSLGKNNVRPFLKSNLKAKTCSLPDFVHTDTGKHTSMHSETTVIV